MNSLLNHQLHHSYWRFCKEEPRRSDEFWVRLVYPVQPVSTLPLLTGLYFHIACTEITEDADWGLMLVKLRRKGNIFGSTFTKMCNPHLLLFNTVTPQATVSNLTQLPLSGRRSPRLQLRPLRFILNYELYSKLHLALTQNQNV